MLLVLLYKWAPQFLSGMLSELGGWWNKPTNHYSASFYVFLKNGKCPNIGQFLYNGRFVQQYFSKSKHSDVMFYFCVLCIVSYNIRKSAKQHLWTIRTIAVMFKTKLLPCIQSLCLYHMLCILSKLDWHIYTKVFQNPWRAWRDVNWTHSVNDRLAGCLRGQMGRHADGHTGNSGKNNIIW